MNVPSLANLPKAPKKKTEKSNLQLDSVRQELFPPTPPAAPRKEKKEKSYNLTPIPIDLDLNELRKECEWLGSLEEVREKFLIDLDGVMEETSISWLKTLSELYYPASQPRNLYEYAYVTNVRDLINYRLDTLHM